MGTNGFAKFYILKNETQAIFTIFVIVLIIYYKMNIVLLSNIFQWKSYTFTDYVYSPLLLMLILLIGYMVQKRKIENNPVYRYYFKGLAVKLFSAIIFLLIFTEYYGGGDTIDYMRGAVPMSRLLFKDPGNYWSIFSGKVSWQEAWYYFDTSTEWPPHYLWKGANTRFVINISSLINTIGFRAFMPTTILVAAFSYIGVWKLFLFFTDYFPQLTKQMAIAVLFVPSALFWGSGIMKDTYTFAAAGWFVYNIHMIFYKKQKISLNIFLALINALIIIAIKPYIFAALLPGTIIWLTFDRIKRIRNKLIAAFMLPFIITIGFGIILVGLTLLKGQLGEYGSMETAVKKAQTVQQDLLREEQYGSNSYNIGKIDGTIGGMLKVAPMAVIAGMYRPFLWEARNPVMLISGLENFILLLLTIFLLFKLKFVRFFQFIFSDPILIFSMLFTVFFMFAVGMASANFGALVRYKIPAMPFFVASMFIMLHKYNVYKKGRDGK